MDNKEKISKFGEEIKVAMSKAPSQAAVSWDQEHNSVTTNFGGGETMTLTLTSKGVVATFTHAGGGIPSSKIEF